MRGIHRSPVDSPHKGQWRGALMFSLISTWANNWDTGDLRCHHAHYDITAMKRHPIVCPRSQAIECLLWVFWWKLPCSKRTTLFCCAFTAQFIQLYDNSNTKTFRDENKYGCDIDYRLFKENINRCHINNKICTNVVKRCQEKYHNYYIIQLQCIKNKQKELNWF